MTNHLPGLAPLARRSRLAWAALLVATALVVPAREANAQAPAGPAAAAPTPGADEIDKLVGPIALYPDDLVAIILPAATNPLQLVQADRFLEKRKTDPKLPVDEKWDDAVKSLLNYPDVVNKMSGDLDWTIALGEAVVADQGAVLAGSMIAGFAMIAFPADYGSSGVMSFIVSHHGTVFEKNLGKDSATVGARISAFDPGAGWKPVAP